MATPNPITGQTPLNVGSTVLFTDSTVGGVWSSTNAGIAIVDVNGNVTAVASGICQIVYTVAGNATAFQLTVNPQYSLTNGLNYSQCFAALQNRVLWRSQGATSDSQTYYEGYHSLNSTTILDAIREPGISLSAYLANKQNDVVAEVLKLVYDRPQVVDPPKLVFWKNQTTVPYQFVVNNGQFVGLRIYVGKGDWAIKLNSIQLFFSQSATVTMYLYNDLVDAPLLSFPVTFSAYSVTTVNLGESVILNNLVPQQYKNGWFYLGYYQSDLPEGCQAIYYPVEYNLFHPCQVMAFSTTVIDSPAGTGRNFNRVSIGANNLMYGCNLEISTFRDATNAVVQNAHLFDNLIGYKMTEKVINDIIFNYQTGAVQRAIGSVPQIAELYGYLNGYVMPESGKYVPGLVNKITRAVKQVQEGMWPSNDRVVGTA